jgi:PAS domain S-box-containing protein
MTEMSNKQKKKQIMKDIIRKLHQGLTIEEAKKLFEKEVGTASSTEIAEMEQSLLNEGITPEEIKKFCNVHALLFQSALEKSIVKETSPSHPVYLFKLENRELKKIVDSLKELIKEREKGLPRIKQKLKDLLNKLKDIETHYARKELVLFPFLEKRGFSGPSKVMWEKDNEVRDLLKQASSSAEKLNKLEDLELFQKNFLAPLIEEITGMIFKEENILYPTSLEKLSANDWVEVLKESDKVGYIFIERPKETEALIKDLKSTLLEEPVIEDNEVMLPTGRFRLKELMAVLNTLPVDITFVDSEDKVRYFSDNKERIFLRTKSVIGIKVQNCHPPQSLEAVEKILKSFKDGKRDKADFWINLEGRSVYICYFAVRDKEGSYLGTLEVSQDLTEIKKLEGEKRLDVEEY